MRIPCLALVALLVALGSAPALAQGRIKLPLKREALEAKVKQDSCDAAAHYNVSLAYWNEARYDDAERELKAALAIEPRLAVARLALANLPFARRPKLWEKRYESGLPDSIRAIVDAADQEERHAFVIDPFVDLAIIGAVRPAEDVRWKLLLPDVYEVLFQGYDDVEQGHYEQAYFNFTRLIKMYREDVSRSRADLPFSFLWFQGIAAAHVGKFDVALDNFRTLMDRSKSSEASDTIYHIPLRTNEYRYMVATIQLRSADTISAIQMLQDAARNDLGLYMAHVVLGDIWDAKRNYEQALAERQAAIAANPDDPSLLLDLGVTLGKSGRFAQADSVLHQAEDANPRDSRVPFWLGIAALQLNRTADAKEAFSRYLAIAPSRDDKRIAMARQRLSQLQ